MENKSKNIDKYEGDLKDDEPHGKGTQFYQNGDKYIGDFKNGLKHGHGMYYYANGDKYSGKFEFDEFNGYGIYTPIIGETYKGNFKDGKKYQNDEIDIPRNTQGGIDGCLIVSFGFFLIILGGLLIWVGASYENNLLLLLGVLIGTLVAGYFILYPFVRFFFGGKDSIAAAVATKVVEGIIVHKIIKQSRKKK
mgnify:CR=1 FL=1